MMVRTPRTQVGGVFLTGASKSWRAVGPFAPVFHLEFPAKPEAMAFNAWALHYNQCESCGREDWWDPGFPLLIPKPDRPTLEQHMVRLSNGKESWATYSADPSVLCRDGEVLYRDWVRKATTTL